MLLSRARSACEGANRWTPMGVAQAAAMPSTASAASAARTPDTAPACRATAVMGAGRAPRDSTGAVIRLCGGCFTQFAHQALYRGFVGLERQEILGRRPCPPRLTGFAGNRGESEQGLPVPGTAAVQGIQGSHRFARMPLGLESHRVDDGRMGVLGREFPRAS